MSDSLLNAASKATLARLFLWVCVAWVGTCVVVGAGFLLLSRYGGGLVKPHFSDVLSASSGLFAALAFAGLIKTIWQQQSEIEDSAKAQRKSEKLLGDQAEALLFTARLNALNSLLLQHSNEMNQILAGARAGHGYDGKSFSQARDALDAVIKQIKDLHSEISAKGHGMASSD